jgi:hypothetical protein
MRYPFDVILLSQFIEEKLSDLISVHISLLRKQWIATYSIFNVVEAFPMARDINRARVYMQIHQI